LSARGDTGGARAAYSNVVEQAEKLYGAEHLITLTAREDLAMTSIETPEVALQHLEALLPAFERAGGPGEPRILDLRANIAGAVGVSGDHARARELFGELLSGCERLLGPDDIRTLKVRENFDHASEMASGTVG
jgi:hypothetical protein